MLKTAKAMWKQLFAIFISDQRHMEGRGTCRGTEVFPAGIVEVHLENDLDRAPDGVAGARRDGGLVRF